ncbi:DNA-dependent RNA polymerase II [Marasmius tenuissimus]|nr:DNA-dependent RNA polymerase II [Marasmius tenuissimus]
MFKLGDSTDERRLGMDYGAPFTVDKAKPLFNRVSTDSALFTRSIPRVCSQPVTLIDEYLNPRPNRKGAPPMHNSFADILASQSQHPTLPPPPAPFPTLFRDRDLPIAIRRKHPLYPKNIDLPSFPPRRVLSVDGYAAGLKLEPRNRHCPGSLLFRRRQLWLRGEEGFGEITQEDCWTAISSFFEQKGLVRQQLDSFDEFVQNTMQELVDENSDLILDQAEQFSGQQTDSSRRYEIKFGQICLSRPTVTEADGLVVPVFPQEARLRNLTFYAPLYIEMKKRVSSGHEEGGEMVWETENDSGAEGTKVWIGKVPIMLRSTFCILRGLQDQDLYDLNECPYDSGGYFIINGSEKALIAQERMATNHVYVFAKAQPSPINFLAEIRSAVEKGGKTISQFQVKMFHRNQERSLGNVMKATIPYIKVDIPIWVVFRALGVISDRDILEHICYDMQDIQMLEMLKPCIDDGFVIQDREVALDFIGNRGTTTGLSRERRIRYAQEILQKEMLPHVSMAEGSESKKAYFFGYMIHRLLLAALERRELDD